MHAPTIQIANRLIGKRHPPYMVAELSGNHKGDLGRALALIDAAAEAGADAVKIQTYTPDTITFKSDRPEFFITSGPWSGRSLYDLYKEAHTPYEWHEALFLRAAELGVPMFSSPFDETAVDLLSALDAPAYKVASFEIVDLPLIERIAQQGKPIIFSTGMARLGEIEAAVATARKSGVSEFGVLHCTSAYPAPVEDANVRTVPHLGETFNCVSGLSDHTSGIAASVAAVVLGGSIVEKHLTLSRAEGGADANFSLEPLEFRTLVSECRAAWLSLGDVEYEVLGVEAANIMFRRSLYVVATIPQGQALGLHNIRSIRPGCGLAPKHLSAVLGRKAKRLLNAGEPLSWDDLE